MKKEDISFIITSFKSTNIIKDCLNSLPKNSEKIVIENSNDNELKLDIEKNYSNLKCFLMEENLGYGKANNFGIKKTKKKYIFILNPDTILPENSLDILIKILSKEKFTIAAPITKEDKYKTNFMGKKTLDVEYVKGHSMLINKKNLEEILFDENIFLYLEEIDLCKRIKEKNRKIILVDAEVKHIGGNSHNSEFSYEIEKSQNWHWMWSKFYFEKKYKGYFFAFLKTFPNLLSSIIKTTIYLIIFNKKKHEIYKMRLLGLLNSYLLKKSKYRPKIKVK
tara:strand:+ start:999 stop:1835 length:837 start_codon:yes stop_codon:yes gene_type:complete